MSRKKDTVTQKCINCHAEFTGVLQRAKYCSDVCRKQYNRNVHKGFSVTNEQSSVTSNRGEVSKNTGKHQSKVTVTDQAFIDDASKRGLGDNYYNFSKEIQDRQCLWCGNIFHTRLKLNKVCSPSCRDALLNGLTR